MTVFLLAPLCFYISLALGYSVFLKFKHSAAPDETLLFSSILGLGLLSYLILLTGLLGFLNSGAVIAILGALALFAIFKRRVIFQTWRLALPAWKIQLDAGAFLILGLFSVTCLCLLAGLMAPETANDSLCYHLHLPKVFLLQGHITRVPYEINSLFPFLMEMLFTLGLTLKSVPLAKFFHVLTGLLTFLGIISLSRRSTSSFAAWSAAVLFLTTPGIINQLPSTYVDVGYSAYSFFTVWAFLKWRENHERGWLILSGLLMGFTLGIKYLGVISFFAISIALIIMPRIEKRKFYPSELFLFFAAAALTGGYWYLRSWIEWGNPVYPYFAWLFRHGDPAIHYEDVGVAKTFWNFLMIPWTTTMAPYRFEGYGNNLGPAFLAWVPGLWILKRSFQGRGFLTFYVLFYLGCWFLLGQSLRFLFPILPVLAVFMAYSIDELSRHYPKWLIQSLVAIALSSHTALALYHYRGDFRHLLGLENSEAYLTRTERTYSVAAFINNRLPKNAKVLSVDEVRLFYIDRAVVREDLYARDTAYDKKANSPAEILLQLKNEGFTHILYTTASHQPSSLNALRVSSLLQDPQNALALSLKPLYTYEFKDHQANVFQYTLYEMAP